jgi:hypothetical protein
MRQQHHLSLIVLISYLLLTCMWCIGNPEISSVRQFGGIGVDEAWSIVSSQDGSTYITGTINQQVTFAGVNCGPNGGTNIFVAKYNSNAQESWIRCFGGTGEIGVKDIAVDTVSVGVDHVYITGYLAQSVSFDTTTLVGANRDIFLVKINGDSGSVIWATSAGTNNNDEGVALAIHPFDHSIYLTGMFIVSYV